MQRALRYAMLATLVTLSCALHDDIGTQGAKAVFTPGSPGFTLAETSL